MRNLHLFYEDTSDLLRRNIGDISSDLNNCWITEENSFPSVYHKGLICPGFSVIDSLMT